MVNRIEIIQNESRSAILIGGNVSIHGVNEFNVSVDETDIQIDILSVEKPNGVGG